MQLEQLLNHVPEYAKDLKLNLGSVTRQTELTEQQTWGTVVACAIVVRNPQLLESLLAEAATHLNEQALFAAKAAAAIMGMNNIFYRFRHLSSNEKYATMPARLRMQVIAKHGSDPVDFELWCLAVSAINGRPRKSAARKRCERGNRARRGSNRVHHSRASRRL